MIKRQKPQWKKEKPKVIFNMNALTFITCGSVDDGKSTLIGRLLMDSKAVLSDQLASASRRNSLTGNGEQPDLAAFTDGLQAEREQGITIDVAWRYFSTPIRKYIIGDTPGHEQYTRNMVTAATNADAAVVIVDATKLDWQQAGLSLLPQTRRHTLLLKLLRVDSVVFAVNKLDAVADAAVAFAHIGNALRLFSQEAGINAPSIVPISALQGYNVVSHTEEWAGYNGPSLLELLETMPTRNQIDLDTAHAVEAKASSPATRDTGDTPHFNVQWVEQRAATLGTASRWPITRR
jgi:sulfate adenylyltransferase subunit 1